MCIGAVIAKKKVTAAFDLINQRNLTAFLADWADDAIFFYPGDLSISGKIEGKKAITEWFQKFLEQFPKIHFTVKNVYVQNIFALGGTNVVAVETAVALTNREGKDFQNKVVSVINLHKGKAVLGRDYLFDTEMLKEAWGEEKSRA